MSYSISQVSMLYAVVIMLFYFLGYSQHARLSGGLSMQFDQATGGLFGGLVGILLSFGAYRYAQSKGMIV
jgi:hypothetical protein